MTADDITAIVALLVVLVAVLVLDYFLVRRPRKRDE